MASLVRSGPAVEEPVDERGELGRVLEEEAVRCVRENPQPGVRKV
jgi:hypothetical protein